MESQRILKLLLSTFIPPFLQHNQFFKETKFNFSQSLRWFFCPLVMLSSIGKQEIIQQARDIRFAAIVNKPIPQSQLYRILVQAIAGTPIKVTAVCI